MNAKQREGSFLQMRDLNLPQPVKMGLYSGFYDVHFVNMDNPEDRTVVSVEAHANDNGDKAPGKAMTYAVKIGNSKTVHPGDWRRRRKQS